MTQCTLAHWPYSEAVNRKTSAYHHEHQKKELLTRGRRYSHQDKRGRLHIGKDFWADIAIRQGSLRQPVGLSETIDIATWSCARVAILLKVPTVFTAHEGELAPRLTPLGKWQKDCKEVSISGTDRYASGKEKKSPTRWTKSYRWTRTCTIRWWQRAWKPRFQEEIEVAQQGTGIAGLHVQSAKTLRRWKCHLQDSFKSRVRWS